MKEAYNRNPNEHKFKPSIPKLQGFNKRQTNKKKKQKLSISIETNKMSIMDILFSGQSIDKLTGYIRLSTFEELISNCRPKRYGYEYIQYKISTKKPLKYTYDLETYEYTGGPLLNTLQHMIEVNAQANMSYQSTEFNPRLFTDAIDNYTGHIDSYYSPLDLDDYMLQQPSSIYQFYYQQYREYTKSSIKFTWYSPLTIIDDMLLPSHTPSITNIRLAHISRKNVYGYHKAIRYALTKFAIENGVDIDKWRHTADIENKRQNMMVLE